MHQTNNMAIYMDLSGCLKTAHFDIITVNDKQDFMLSLLWFKMRLDDHMSEKLYKPLFEKRILFSGTLAFI